MRFARLLTIVGLLFAGVLYAQAAFMFGPLVSGSPQGGGGPTQNPLPLVIP